MLHEIDKEDTSLSLSLCVFLNVRYLTKYFAHMALSLAILWTHLY